MKIDGYDVITLIGLGLLVAGVGMLSIPAALITGGACLISAGILGARSGARKGGK